MQLLSETKTRFSERIYSLTADLHAHPELSFEEKRTSAIIKEELEHLGIEVLDLGLETGVVGLLRGRGEKTIALRADIDAIVQHEEYIRPDKSIYDGVMHGCGHDTHTTSLLGAAMLLSSHRDELSVNVLFVFQPAEEKLSGARYMLAHNIFSQYPPSIMFGLHNLPELPVGTVGVKSGPLMSFKDGFRVKYIGKSGHTSTPQKNIDPTVAIASLIMSLETIVSRNVGPLEAAVLTVCSIHSGEPFTTTIDDAEITGNIRSLDEDVRNRILEHVELMARNTAEEYGCECELEFIPITRGVCNSESLLKVALNAGNKVFSAENVRIPSINMASEDFSVLSEGIPSFFYFLGSGVQGEKPYLWHNPMFHTALDTPVYGAALLAQSVFSAQGVGD